MDKDSFKEILRRDFPKYRLKEMEMSAMEEEDLEKQDRVRRIRELLEGVSGDE